MRQTIIALVVFWAGLSGQAVALTTTNLWQGGDGKWETKKQWSLNQIPDSNQDIVVANTGTFTVTIDNRTASHFPSSLTVSSLSMSNTAGSSILLLTNDPTGRIPITLTISNSAIVGAGSMLDLVDASSIGAGVTVQASNLIADSTIVLSGNATLSVANGLLIGSSASRTGVVSVVGGTLVANPSVGSGILLTSNGVLQASFVDVGVLSNAHGVWQTAAGSNTVNGNVSIGVVGGATGEVVMASGGLTAREIVLGTLGSMAISNGTVSVNDIYCANALNGAGTVTVAGGTVTLFNNMYVGYGGTGTVWQTGGEIDVPNRIELARDAFIGTYSGQLISSGGVLRAHEIDVGPHDFLSPQSPGSSSWTMAGGTASVDRVVAVIGDTNHSSSMTVSGGQLQTTQLGLGGPTTISGGEVQVTSLVDVAGYPPYLGSLTVSGGRLTTPELDADGGTVTITGGQIQVTRVSGSLGIQIDTFTKGTGTVVLAGGELDSTNFPTSIGVTNAGQMIVSSGTFNAFAIYLGQSASSVGTLVISGGVVNTLAFPGLTPLIVGGSDLARFGAKAGTGTVWFTGGALKADAITVGDTGFGSMYVSSNATLQSHVAGFGPIDLVVGNQNGGVGLMSIQGGTLFPSPTRQVGSLQVGVSAGSTGTVWVTDGALEADGDCIGPTSVGRQGSGRLSATNSTLTLHALSVGSAGTLECVNSHLYASGFAGCPVANSNVMLFVNSTGEFDGPVQNTGIIVANGNTLTFYGMVNNTGLIVLTNGTAQFLGGINNTGAVLFGPDKFLITSVSATGSDVAITWQTFAGNHYRVQAANGLTDAFSDVSSDIIASGSGFGTTNYVDFGAVTNAPGRFYRVRHIY